MRSTTRLKSEVDSIVKTLESKKIEYTNGSIGWVSIWPFDERDPTVIHDATLYRGQTGIGFFLAAHGYVTESAQSLELAHQVFQPWLKTPPEMIEIDHANGMTGISSLVYALMECSKFLDDSMYLKQAVDIAASIDIEAIQSDERNDILAGNAGLLLVLTELVSVTQQRQDKIRRRALVAADRLLDTATSTDSGVGIGWNTVENYPQTGFAHGGTGIAYALLKAFQVFSEPKYQDTAREALAFEDSLFELSRHNWAASANRRRYQRNWCWGSEGILLGRFAMQATGLDYTMPEETTRILSEFLSRVPAGHSLCHGVAGRAMVLNYLRERLSPEVPCEIAPTSLLEQVRSHRLEHGHYDISGLEHAHASRLSLFRGISGVGYACLYDQYQSRLPNPLLLESSLE